MNKAILQRVLLFQYFLVFCWPVYAYAGQFTFTYNEAKTYLPAILAATGLSIMSGLTLVMTDMIEEYMNRPRIEKLWLFIASRISGSLTMGILAFSTSAKLDLDFATTCISIILAGFGGTTLLKKLVERYVSRMLESDAMTERKGQ
jgi:NO-binding membrane sensor protein with MHYT domain